MASVSSRSCWFNVRHERPSARVRLICFPWSGGGSQWYANWGRLAPAHVEVVGLTFPKRESRFTDAPYDTMKELTDIIAREIRTHLSDKPFAFFGHSFGVSTSFEVCRKLSERSGPSPTQMFFSGHFAPHSEYRRQDREATSPTKWHTLSDEDLTDRVKRLGGMPASILADKDFMTNIFLPPFRADLKIGTGYNYLLDETLPPPLTCPITIINGESDLDFKTYEFHELTEGSCSTFTLTGGHFYLLSSENSQKLMDIISDKLKS